MSYNVKNNRCLPVRLVDSANSGYCVLVAVYLIYIYFKNICNFIRLYKNKLYICIRVKEVIFTANSNTTSYE